jgi:hypothetical protein
MVVFLVFNPALSLQFMFISNKADTWFLFELLNGSKKGVIKWVLLRILLNGSSMSEVAQSLDFIDHGKLTCHVYHCNNKKNMSG